MAEILGNSRFKFLRMRSPTNARNYVYCHEMFTASSEWGFTSAAAPGPVESGAYSGSSPERLKNTSINILIW